MGNEMSRSKQIAYHSTFDDCVSSMTYSLQDISRIIAEWKENPDIDSIWTRDENGNVDWEWYRH